jgi:hypothetical protein
MHDARVNAGDEKQRWRRYGPEFCLLLWATWDPIGVGVPLDEYDNYAPPVWTLLARGASEEEIASHLRDVRERMMEVGGDEQDARLRRSSGSGGTAASENVHERLSELGAR